MLRKYILATSAIALMGLSSCQDLDLSNPSTISPDDVWDDTSLIEMYVNNLYNALPGWDYCTWNNITDEARDNFSWASPNAIIKGQWNESNNPMDCWGNYTSIRTCNEFLSQIGDATVPDDVKARTSAEARFIRAILYFNLVKSYGGVPLITEPQGLEDDLEVPRASMDECFRFIIDETEEIADNLPLNAERGKITKGAALALRARALLFYASPLYNESGDNTRWQAAANAAKEVINLGKYSLYPDLKNLWLDKSATHPEIILERQYGMPNVYHGWDCLVKPLDLANGDAGHCSPVQDLVDAFPMRNGKLIHEEGSGYDPANPYEGRDDRFYADIAYNQAVISGMQGGELNHNYQLQIYVGGNDYDNPQGNPQWQVYTTYTGYFCVKAVDPNNDTYGYWYGSTQPWIEMRYAEVLLNFAEAQNEATGPTEEIYAALDELRHRAGITENLPRNYTKDSLRELIYNERYVELCFEYKRYWDIRRWKRAMTMLNRQCYGVVITKHDDGSFTYDYQPVDNEPTVFEEKMYFMPIPISELSKNRKLTQNPGWPANE